MGNWDEWEIGMGKGGEMGWVGNWDEWEIGMGEELGWVGNWDGEGCKNGMGGKLG